MLTPMVKMLQNCIVPVSLHKVKAHAEVVGNEEVDKLAKSGNKLTHLDPIEPYEFVHSTPIWFCLNEWPSILKHPYKGPIRFLKEVLDKQEKNEKLALATNFQSISNWTNDTLVDNISSNNFWENPTIFDAQITQLLKF
jgi:hypothetical protein